jgi:hypothetical protein
MPSRSTEIHEVSRLTRDQVAAVLLDLKRRIQGDFYVIEQDDEKIVLGNRVLVYFKQTPQARAVAGREYFQSDI